MKLHSQPQGDARAQFDHVLETLAPRIKERAAAHDDTDTFAADNFAAFKAHRVFAAAVPTELGGGGAGVDDLTDFLRRLAACCGSTALALSMHTHLVATLAWRWRHGAKEVEPLLRRVAAENLVLISTGGADWLRSSGKAARTASGYRISARKAFASGVPAGDLLMTSAVLEDAATGPMVLHFGVPLRDRSVKLLDTWRVLGMRASGSQDVLIEDYVVPDSAVSLRRQQGIWHPLFLLITLVALPIVYSVYVGLAEAAREKALQLARKRAVDDGLCILIGEMDNLLAQARLALQSMIARAMSCEPTPQTANSTLMERTLAGRAAIAVVDKALEVAGGAGFYRDAGLERLFRDVQAARFHPLPEKAQLRHSGRLALGLEP
jgi:acyl-CoA dehydrogenase